MLWHAQSLLREFRGDDHIAALTVEGLSGCEALVTHGLAGEVPSDTLPTAEDTGSAPTTTGRRPSSHSAGAAGSTTTAHCTELGRERRQWIEERTDELSIGPYAAIGDDRCAAACAGRPWSVGPMERRRLMAAIG